MRFDNIIIGGGLAGLACGIELQRHGGRNLIISSGQSALHFCSGSFDLLSALPDGRVVTSPTASYNELIAQNPNHPYSKPGRERFEQIALRARDFLAEAGIQTNGTPFKNHQRISPLGHLLPTWLTFDGFANSEITVGRAVVVGFCGVNDFYPRRIAEAFGIMTVEGESSGQQTDVIEVDLAHEVELRSLPTPRRLADIARAFGNPDFVEGFAHLLGMVAEGYDTVVLPDAVGFDNIHARGQLEALTGKRVVIAATFPPSVSGIEAQRMLRRRFEQLGGVYMLGDQVIKGEIKGNRVVALFSENHGSTPLCAENVVLASGSFFSKGLCASQSEVFEPLCGIDIFGISDRNSWYNERMLGKQPYNTFGASTDSQFRALKCGVTIENLYCCGSLLGGYDSLSEGSGAGVAIISGIAVAENIMNVR